MPKSLSPRIKKLIFLAILFPALLFYCLAAMILADFIPEFWLFKLVYFVVIGTVWAFPLKHFMLWANRP